MKQPLVYGTVEYCSGVNLFLLLKIKAKSIVVTWHKKIVGAKWSEKFFASKIWCSIVVSFYFRVDGSFKSYLLPNRTG